MIENYSIRLEAYQAIYIDIAKVASSSIKARLADAMGLSVASNNPHDIAFPRPSLAQQEETRFYPGYFTFAFVRNPWERLVSCYRDKICGEVRDFTEFTPDGVAHCLAGYDEFSANMSFTDFVRAVAAIPDSEADEHFRSQAALLTNTAGQVAVDFVGRFETLDIDFRSVAEHIGLPMDRPLRHLQAVTHPGHDGYHTPATRAITRQRYARDIELFGYDVHV